MRSTYQVNEPVELNISSGGVPFDLWLRGPDGWFLALQNVSGGVSYVYVPALVGNYSVRAEFFVGEVTLPWSADFEVIGSSKPAENLSNAPVQLGDAVVGLPVNWSQEFVVEGNGSLCLPLPPDAFGLEVYEGDGLISSEPCVNLSEGLQHRLMAYYKTSPVELVQVNVSEYDLSEFLPVDAFEVVVLDDGREEKDKTHSSEDSSKKKTKINSLFRKEYVLRHNSSLTYSNVSFEVQEDFVDFGLMSPGEASLVASVTNILNVGNTVLDIFVLGSGDMSCDFGTIGIGNISFNHSEGGYYTMDQNRLSTVSQTDVEFDLGVEGVATADDVVSARAEYWTIKIPYGYARGRCNSTITVGAVID